MKAHITENIQRILDIVPEDIALDVKAVVKVLFLEDNIARNIQKWLVNASAAVALDLVQ